MPEACHPIRLLSLGLALAAATAAAQNPQAPLPASAPAQRLQRLVVEGGVGVLQFSPSGTGPDRERVIKGAPYCAEVQQETVQWLPDAGGAASNSVTNRQSARVCRDGEGRTRREVERGGRMQVHLSDPVARERWLIDPERKTASRMAWVEWRGADEPLGGPAWRAYSERVRSEPPSPPVPPGASAPTVVMRSASGVAGEDAKVMQFQGVERWALPANRPVQPVALPWSAQMPAPRGAGSTSPLGSKDFDGLPAYGERTTWLIEAGTMGNERPIQVTREVWTSPDLLVTVQSRDYDPRSAEVNYQLTNLRRGEPTPALMRVPADVQKYDLTTLVRHRAPASAVPQ